MPTDWPPLPLDAWRATRDTLHRYAQILGKVQLASTPLVNHFWNAALRVSARGLATTTLRHEGRSFDLELDLVEHRLVVRTGDGATAVRELRPRAVAEFYREVVEVLASLGIAVRIWDHPVEIASEAIPFPHDRVHAAYDRAYAERFFRVLSSAAELLEQFRARFTGKCSGVGFYWGTFDVAVARYSGRSVPGPAPGGVIEREAYSHEVSEAGFWTGDAAQPAPAFFSLHAPVPEAFPRAPVAPAGAHWHEPSRCFVLPYEAARASRDPSATILEFCQSAYEAGAELAGWNRVELERPRR